jgi:predicted enzyme related to lactoylglutathione lyase
MILGALTFDAGNPGELASFWAALLGRTARPGRTIPGVWVVEPRHEEPVPLFLPVPEPKSAKNRCHPDLHTAQLDADVARAVGLGATAGATHDEAGRWVVLADPEGNEFCLVQDDAVQESS